MRLVLAALLVFLPLCACASGTKGSQSSDFVGEPTLVRLISYRSGVKLELANESHTSRVDQYSEVRTDAARKITTDEVMDELTSLFVKRGFDEVAQDGPAPPGGGDLMAALELVRDGRPRSIVIGAASTARQREVFSACRDNFVPLYNQVYGLQAIDNPDGSKSFRTPAAALEGDRR